MVCDALSERCSVRRIRIQSKSIHHVCTLAEILFYRSIKFVTSFIGEPVLKIFSYFVIYFVFYKSHNIHFLILDILIETNCRNLTRRMSMGNKMKYQSCMLILYQGKFSHMME